MQKNWWRGFARRTAIALGVVGVGYGLFFILPNTLSERRQAPTRELAALKALMADNQLAFQALVNYKPTGVVASIELINLRSHIDESRSRLQTVTDQPISTLPAEMVKSAKRLLDRQKTLLEAYDGRYNALDKVILYIPANDVGTLDLLSERDKVVQRAQAANAALNSLAATPSFPLSSSAQTTGIQSSANSFSLDENILKPIQQSAACFEQLVKELTAGQTDAARITRNICIGGYEALRTQSIHTTLLAFQNDDTKSLLGDMEALLKQLDQ